ncbi:hypothetical protein CBS147346_9641 [Aspergillus niger]|nr:hypothetical protein CBS147346_9641 [Aspergillus niger]
MNRNRRADDLGALMLPSGSTGFSKALDCAEPRRFLDLVDRHRIFLGFAPNFFLALLYDRICRSTPKQEAQPAPTWGLSGLRCVFSGGEPPVRQPLLRLVHHVRIPDLTSSFTLVFAHLAPDAHLRPTAQLRSGRCSSHAVISKEPRSVCPPDPTSGALDPEREAHEALQPGLSSLDFYTVTQDLHQTFGVVLPLPTFSGNRPLPILPTASASQ